MKPYLRIGALLCSAAVLLSSCGGGGSSSFLTSAKSSMDKAEKAKLLLFAKTKKEDIDKINNESSALYRTAKVNLEKEVALGSSSANIGEAWFLMGKATKELNLADSAAMAFKEADKLLGTQKKEDIQMRSEMGGLLFEVWVANINKAVENYNAGRGEASPAMAKQKYNECIKNCLACLDAKPENIDIVYGLLTASYQELGDTAKALVAQEKYLSLNKPVVDALVAKGIQFQMSRDEVMKALGAPAEAKQEPMPDKANPKPEVTRLFDKYTSIIPGKEIYLHYPKTKDKGEFLLDGFSAPPSSWMQQEKDRSVSFEHRNYLSLAYQYYTKKEWDKAIRYAEEGAAFKSNDEDLQNFLPTLYTESGKTDIAMAKMKEKSDKNPNDKVAHAQYGAMLANLEKYDEAIVLFEKSLKVDPAFDNALFNAAAAYKNKAVAIQRDEQKKADDAEAARKKDKKAPAYTMDGTKYKPALEKAAEYFERYRKLPGKDRDVNTLEQLINVYDVLDNKEKYRQAAGEFAALEYANQNNPRFFEMLARIYGKQKNAAKVKESLEKADALRKSGAK